MGVLEGFEHGLERAVNGAFAKTFRSSLQPLEISSALKAQMDSYAQTFSRDRVVAPHEYSVAVSPQDAERMRTLGQGLQDQLTDALRAHATRQGYALAGPLIIDIHPDPKVSVGMLEVTPRSSDAPIELRAVLDVNGHRFPLARGQNVVGRGHEATIVLTEGSVSKRHAILEWDGTRVTVQDLHSTNGTFVDGRRVSTAEVPERAELRFGAARGAVRIVPTPSDGSI
jgi:hypothetical protein